MLFLASRIHINVGTPQPDFDLNAQVHPSPDALLQATGDEAIVLDTASEQFFGLNVVGARLWQLLSDNPSLEAAHQRLLDEYDVEPERLQRDLQAIVAQLAQNGLVRIA